MDRLQRLELCDIGTFSGERVFDLSGRLVGIVGANGRGKSTILSTIHFCATGDTSRLGKTEAICAHRAKTDQPYGRLIFSVAGSPDPAALTRWLPDKNLDGRRKLVHGRQSWTRLDDIRDQMTRWCGVNADVLSEFVFVEQGRLASVVEAKPAQRAEVLQKLFGLREAEKAREAAVDYLATLPAAPDAQVLASLRARYVEAETALHDAEGLLGLLPPSDSSVDADRELVATYATQNTSRIAAERLRGAIQAGEELLAAPAVPYPDAEEYATLQRLDRDWTAWQARDQARKAADSRLSRLERELSDLPNVPESPGLEPVPSAELMELQTRRYALEAILSAPDHGGTCPICDGPLQPELANRAESQNQLQRLLRLEEGHRKDVAEYRRVCSARDRGVDAARRLRDEIAAIMLELADAPTTPRPQVSWDNVKLLLEDHTRRRSAATADAEQRRQAASRLAEDRVKLAQIRIAATISEEDAAAATRRVRASDEIESRRRELQARIQALREGFASSTRLLRDAEDSGRRSDELDAHRQRILAVRDVLHRNSAPALAVKDCLDKLSVELNRTLAVLRARFRVKVRDDGELTSEFHDGTTTSIIRAARMSKGERAVLGLAWTIAAAERYAPRVGVLALDEPTDGLDRERVTALRSALAAWQESGGTRQVLVVTHERALMGVFDQVIDLG